ncbi:hypothetical protein COU76_05220 [Candidatus Peregrinibacteria bacterium CG10_big_fil_rev_8_21_14_0_10_49_10]|nr:MAG: hypothetical protein COU76_05220 [Candidatus Peregrinibacteria bacterium CG10_big_fil_rev_8_21_14_0_10_49_10]
MSPFIIRTFHKNVLTPTEEHFPHSTVEKHTANNKSPITNNKNHLFVLLSRITYNARDLFSSHCYMPCSRTSRQIALWLLFCPFVFSLGLSPVQAAVNDPLRIEDDAVVSRGDFIRAAVRAFDLNTEDVDADPLPYSRIPNALIPFLRVAHENGALKVFGKNLLLAQGITKSEALQVAVALGALSPQGKPDHTFRDVHTGTALEKAVTIALEQNWMAPLSSSVFGANRMLVGRDGNLLLRKIRGDDVSEPTRRNNSTLSQVPTIKINFSPQAPRPLPKSEILETLWQLVNEEYLYEDKIHQDDAAYSAAEALMKSLGDPYTTFMRPVSSRSFQTQINGEVSGIGAQVEYIDGYLTIVTPLPGSPAEASGLKPGDQVLAVDGFSIVDIGFLEAVERVRGEKGSTATLHIRRAGIEFDVQVTRDVIKVSEIDISWQGKVAVVKIVQFGRITENDLRGLLEEVNLKKPTGLILDLRNNPGGLLEAAVSVMSNFVPKGSDVTRIVSRNKTRVEKTNEEPSIDPEVRMAVLINGGSASASEIVAGALQDHKRAVIVGEKSFGKGTVQQVLQFNDQSAMKMTVAEWLTPNGRKINGDGIMPDVVVLEGERDEQMSRALELLRR